ncbi:hypothetical protein GLAREA_06037 [Glarea lozoyensis ATCC 20868]|uniref:Uncharacterized protein n=1 Tax=Glarea lozoyensis (strain ATCC 20868 / MF5171) TaxID=1116229 RepID=S3D5H4_GLAL2|nr:uncharacterized protein GLAREA_06037 [Glarea lozoyensis ATCC 20868]EPE33025.1 hypothetical protein GLAREA_06037 [Glarea lozoyensis ATCC 20868]
MEMTRSQFPVEDLDLSGMGFEETAIVNVTNAVRAASRRQRIHQAEIEFEETITQLETRFAGLVESQTFLSSRLSQERDAIEDVFDDCLNIGVSINHFRTAEINRDEEGNFDEDFTFRSLFQRVRGLRQRSEERLDRLEDRIRDDAIEALVDVDSWDELPFRSED